MEDNRNFYDWYKTKITENDQDPPQDAWQNIADELDTNEVWDRIAVELDRPSGWFSKATYYALPALLLLLLSGGGYYYFNKTDYTNVYTVEIATNKDGINTIPPASTPDTPPHTLSDEQSERSAGIGETTSPAEKNKAASPDGDGRSPVSTGDSNVEGSEVAPGEDGKGAIAKHADKATVAGDGATADNTADAPIDEAEDAVINEAERVAIDEAEDIVTDEAQDVVASIRPVVMHDSMRSIHPVFVELHPDSIRRISTPTDPEEDRYARTFEFGITASAKNTWLLNRTTLAGLEKNTLTTTLPDFGKDLGMVFVYNFSPAFSAQAEGMFISEAGQRYKEYHNGKYVTRDVDLRYYTLNVLLKYNRSKAVYGLPFSGHGIIGGLYAGMLNKATENIGRESFDKSSAYEKINYGVIVGYEYNRYVLPNLVLSSGLRLNYGFPNIDTNLFSRTFTGSLDLNIAVRYRVGL